MAVYTEVTDEALNAFLADYDLGRVLSFKGIAEGVENTNYLLRTEPGPFILTLYEKRVQRRRPAVLSRADGSSGRPRRDLPAAGARPQGVALGRLAGRAATIVTFLDGLWIRRPKAAHCAQVGEALAQDARGGARVFAQARRTRCRSKTGRSLFEAARPRADEVSPGLAEETAAELAFLQANWPRDLPEGVIHADLFPDNVFFLGDKLSGLIDFYFACNDASPTIFPSVSTPGVSSSTGHSTSPRARR